MINTVIQSIKQTLSENLVWYDHMPDYFATAERKQVGDIIKQIPLGWFEDWPTGRPAGFHPLWPDSKHMSLMFFEDYGMNKVANTQFDFQHKTRLIVIANSNKIKKGLRADELAASLLYIIPTTFSGVQGIAQGVRMEFTGMTAPGWHNLFARYTLEEKEKQFLMYPYIAFGMEFIFTYRINTACDPITELDPELC